MNGPTAGGDYPEDNLGQFHRQDSGYGTQPQSVVIGHRNASQNSLTAPYLPHPHSKEGTSFEHEQPYPANPALRPPVARRPSNGLQHNMGEWMELNVSLLRHETGFGFRIVGGTEEGSQVCFPFRFVRAGTLCISRLVHWSAGFYWTHRARRSGGC